MLNTASELNPKDDGHGHVRDVAADPQDALNAYFRHESSYWERIYERDGVKEAIHQERLRAALAMVDELALPSQSRVLDAGCGAGYATIALASRGLAVDALDPVEAMVRTTRRRAADSGAQVAVQIGDVHALPFPDERFALLVALGVLPWLPGLDKPLNEMARVLRPGGHLIVTIDCLWQLRHALDPLRTPLVQWLKPRVHQVLEACGRSPKVRSHMTSLRAMRQALAAEGFEERRGLALGFGPFTFLGREILPQSIGLKLERRLQALANRSAPLLKSTGSQYLVLARKRDAPAPSIACRYPACGRRAHLCASRLSPRARSPCRRDPAARHRQYRRHHGNQEDRRHGRGL
jgi:ubiquinone/menaquinone biosynthesis C-methylase UbiE